MHKGQKFREPQKDEVIALAAGCAFLFGYYIFGKAGRGAMPGFICMSMMLLVVDIYVIHILVTGFRQRRIKMVSFTTLAMAVVVLVLSWFVLHRTVDVAKDIREGTQKGILTDCSVQTTYGPKGSFNLHYYLTGYDENGDRHRFEISGKDADNLRNRTSVIIEYYPNIERIYEY